MDVQAGDAQETLGAADEVNYGGMSRGGHVCQCSNTKHMKCSASAHKTCKKVSVAQRRNR